MEDNVMIASWVGGVYRKFEALCMEADEMMRQEAQTFIENHLQNMGANVKQFCSEFVRDVLPQSSNESSTEVKQHDLVSKATTDTVTDVKQSSNELAVEKKQLQIQKHDMLPEKTDLGESVSCNNPLVEVTLKTELPSEVTVEESYYEEKTQRQCDEDGLTSEDSRKPAISDDLLESYSSSNDDQSSVAAELADFSEDESLNIEHAHNEQQITAGNSDSCSIDATSVLISPNGVKLDESCIVVDDDLELSTLSSQEKRHWTYKKKLKQVLSLASKSMKHKQRNPPHPAAARSEVREQEEDGYPENCESDWEII